MEDVGKKGSLLWGGIRKRTVGKKYRAQKAETKIGEDGANKDVGKEKNPAEYH